MTMSLEPHPAGRPLHRDLLLKLLETALFMGYTRFARQAALDWLAIYPGDLPVNLIYTQTLLKDGSPSQALPVLLRICQTDPEYLEAAQARLDAEIMLQAEADQLPGSSRQGRRLPKLAEALGCVIALGGEAGSQASLAKGAQRTEEATLAVWSQSLRKARQALENGNNRRAKSKSNLEQAEANLHPALAAVPATPLVAATHLRILQALGTPLEEWRPLIEHYQNRWPDCLHFTLLLAEARMHSGDTDQAVALLHLAAARDITGQVAIRLWGSHHPYRGLWPTQLEMFLHTPIPAAVTAALGWNQLPPGQALRGGDDFYGHDDVGSGLAENTSPGTKVPGESGLPLASEASPSTPGAPVAHAPKGTLHGKRNRFSLRSQAKQGNGSSRHPDAETLVSVKEELDRVADRLHKPGLAQADGRFPVYIVLTTRRGLEEQYGQQAGLIAHALQELADAVGRRRDWRGLVFYADEGLPGLPGVRHNDPWAIKLSLTDLDDVLASRGEMVGSLLIAGGPEVVPFHHLPNPVDDFDDDVASDNPYATRDENYFIPEWPVGRLPGGSTPDPQLLLKTIRALTRYHLGTKSKRPAAPWYRRYWRRLWRLVVGWLPFAARSTHKPAYKQTSFGYTAAIWRKASLQVFRPIGEPRWLRISPPEMAAGEQPSLLPAARLGYFNLHGLVDAAEWYGQPDATDGFGLAGGSSASEIRTYPVAVRPQDVLNSGRAPEVVYSEACYGAHIAGKKVEEALALKFLQAGSQAVVGSTGTAYGSINTPLIAADYLGQAFWQALRQGNPVGEALRQAKIALAREMHQRQGYLDGEDQKTLISFVLYGDPLAQPFGASREAKSILRSLAPPPMVKTVCDRSRPEDLSQPVQPEVMHYIKRVVEQYLPGMAGAQITVNREYTNCASAGHACPTAQLAGKMSGSPGAVPARRVVVLSKQVASCVHLHMHYARLTLDEHNRLVKLVVSR